MYDLSRHDIPKATSRFRPRAEADFLSRAMQNAWELYHQQVMAKAAELQVAEKLLARLKELYPAEDMAVLKRYGVAREIDKVGVRLYDPATTRWNDSTPVELPETILTPDTFGGSDLATGPYWSEDPNLGCKPSYIATLTDQEIAEMRHSHLSREAVYVPRDTLPYFDEILKAKHAYRTQYRQATAWPGDRNSIAGKYPTWGEIEAAFPVLGSYLATLRNRQPVKDAA